MDCCREGVIFAGKLIRELRERGRHDELSIFEAKLLVR